MTQSELLFQAANLTRSASLNLDISFHTNVADQPKWVIKISHPSIESEKVIKCGPLEKALQECIDEAIQKWNVQKLK
jgi:hypothetical protein